MDISMMMRKTMRFSIPVTSLTIAALLATGPALAQATADTPTTTDKIEQKADEAKSKVKDTAHEAGVGITDSWLTAKTKIALFADDRVKGRQVSVETHNGVVTRRGKVDSADARAAASDIAKGIEHVKSVRNELQVVAPSQRDRVDADDKQIGTSARASEVARNVPGVRYVKNDLTYASRSSLEPTRAQK